jgi:hypothetical protein
VEWNSYRYVTLTWPAHIQATGIETSCWVWPASAQRFAISLSLHRHTHLVVVGRQPLEHPLGTPPTYGNGENYGYQTFTLSATQT